MSFSFFQSYFELSHDPSNVVPGQAGFVPPLPTFQLDTDANDHSLGSSGSESSESWHISPSKQDLLNEDNSSESTIIQREYLSNTSLLKLHTFLIRSTYMCIYSILLMSGN